MIRDPEVRRDVVCEVVADLATRGLASRAIVASPITGADGNVEFLAHARREATVLSPEAVAAVVLDAVVTERAMKAD